MVADRDTTAVVTPLLSATVQNTSFADIDLVTKVESCRIDNLDVLLDACGGEPRFKLIELAESAIFPFQAFSPPAN